jgi:tetratricopeptide (TPR) repeat protein
LSFAHSAGYRRTSLLKAKAATTHEPERGNPEPLATQIEESSSSRGDASNNPTFVEYVRRADRHRDESEWRKAEEAYRNALALDPHQAGYWVQHGHMCKEQGRFAEAEISYRSGAALGVAPGDVIEHLRFVLARQGSSEGKYPIRFGKAGSSPATQIPSEADIRLLAQLLWRIVAPSTKDVLKLLRENATCDDAFAAMVADARFEQANVNWLALVEDGEL